MGYNIISDIAGNYKTLLALEAQMPKGEILLSVGDICDRGPQSQKCYNHIMQNGQAVLGNHDHMFLSAFAERFFPEKKIHSGYEKDVFGIWETNGAWSTLRSFSFNEDAKNFNLVMRNFYKKHKHIFDWLEALPTFVELTEKNQEGRTAFVSHAAMKDGENICDAVWTRGQIDERPGKIHIIGHNSHWGLLAFKNAQGETFGMCLDTSREKILTGLHWPSMQVFQQPNID